jgi:predicted transcriptional regulator
LSKGQGGYKKRKYRSRNDIISDILTVALDGGTMKTQLLYGAYVSFEQLHIDYLPLLLRNGLLAFDKEKLRYATTEKGRRFLDAYKLLKI